MNLKYLLKSIPTLQTDFFETFKILSKDPIDSVRINIVDSIMFTVYDNKVFMSSIWPILKPLFEDVCWRVNYACICKIHDVDAESPRSARVQAKTT